MHLRLHHLYSIATSVEPPIANYVCVRSTKLPE
jgi:hypothetical protein